MVRELVKNFSEISVYHLLTDSLQDSNKDGKSSLRKIWKFGKCWLFSILLYLSRSLLISSSFLGREDIDAVILNSFFHLVFFLNLSSHLDPSPCSKTGLREIHVSQIIVQDFHLWILWGYWEECYLVLFITIPSVFFFLRLLQPVHFEIALLIQERNFFSTPFARNWKTWHLFFWCQLW